METRKDLTLARVAADTPSGDVSALELHTGWGQSIPHSGGSGIMVTHSVVPNAAATRGGDYLYARTALAAGKTCMEITTAYTPGGSQVWAWDWCGGRSRVGKSTPLNASFIATYTTPVNGKPSYPVRVEQTNASSGTQIKSGGSWVPLTTSNSSWYSNPPPSGSSYQCPQLKLSITRANDGWLGQIGSGGMTTTRTVGSWGGGFQGEVTVTAGGTAISGWTVTVTWPSGQSIGQLWGGTLNGNQVSNASWNGALAAGASTTFGFIGSGTAATPTLSCARS